MFLHLSMLSFSQENEKKDSISVLKIKLFNSDYKDFEIIKNTVYALTKGGVLVLFDLKKEKIKNKLTSILSGGMMLALTILLI